MHLKQKGKFSALAGLALHFNIYSVPVGNLLGNRQALAPSLAKVIIQKFL
jgi:hypothetical protein